MRQTPDQAAHPLDRPVWTALNSEWQALAVGTPDGWRLSADYGPFAASTDGDAEAVAGWLPRNQDSWFIEADPVAAPRGFVVSVVRELTQMVGEHVPSPAADAIFQPLGAADADAMRALAALASPGPFLPRTHELGRFVGHCESGRLLAMAGTRMQMPGFVEVSGVCTHPDARGRGLAAQASRQVAGAIIAGGAQPFLHAYPDNAPAINLYKALGFVERTRLVLTVISPA